MRPIFLWSEWGSLLFLGLQLKASGHKVTLYIKDESSRWIGTGLIGKTTEAMPPRDALVVFDGVGHGELGQQLRKRGQLVIGGNPFDSKLEKDRGSGIQEMRTAGIHVPLTKSFSDVSSAIKFLEGEQKEFFVKVSGGTATEASTCNAKKDTLIRYLRWVASTPGSKSFILQEKVQGVEISTNGWFDGLKFVPPYEATFEDKKFLEGGLGPRTGCEACVVFLHTPSSILPKETILKIEDRLSSENYCGPVDLNAIIGKDGTVYGLEWTARLGFDATQAWSRFLEPKTMGEQLEAFAAKGLYSWDYKNSTALSYTLRISVPPYPGTSPADTRATRGYPLDKEWLSGDPYFPEDVMLGENNFPVSAGASGLVGVLSAIGPKLPDLQQEMQKVAEELQTPQKQYRVNPLERAEKDWETLRKQGKL